ncbi:kinase-like protein [Stipitochalara longipes BDJ]|nr:kinase-like protein [Stipitochalara longipes BDJ]
MPKDCARFNGGSGCDVDEKPFERGTFKKCHKGTYWDGERKGEDCVVKEFKDGSVYDEYYFQTEMEVVEKTMTIVNRFNAARILGSTGKVKVNMPDIATGVGKIRGLKCMVEPYIKNFEKFNSNSGWVNPKGGVWCDAIQALSHFSYHVTHGRFLLCDLQGGVYQDGFVLTDPIIMSSAGDQGPGDLGAEGIRSWFQKHRCSRYCRSNWDKPGGPGWGAGRPSNKHTVYSLQARPSRMPMSGFWR